MYWLLFPWTKVRSFFDLSCRGHTLNQIWNIQNLRSPVLSAPVLWSCCDFHEGMHVANNKNSVIFVPRAGWIWICFSTHTRRLDATFNRLHILCKLTTHAFVCYVAPYIGCTFRHIFNEVLRMSTDYLPFQMRYNIRCKGLCKLSGTTKSSRQFWKQNVLVTFPVDESLFIFLFVLQSTYFEPNLKYSKFTQPRYYSFDHHVEHLHVESWYF